MPKRILIIQRVLTPYRFRFFQALARSPHLDLALANGDPTPESALESVKTPDEALHFYVCNRFLGKNEWVVWSSGLLRLITPARFDVIIAEFNPRILSNLVACALARIRGLRFIWWGHGISPRSRSSSLITGIRLALIKWSDAVILYEESMATHLIECGVPKAKLFVARNTIDTDQIEQLRAAGYPEERFRILYVGRLIISKKLLLLVRAFAVACPNLLACTRLTIVGDGPERAALATEIEHLGLTDRVDLIPGTYDEHQLALYFNTAWLSIAPGPVGLLAIHSLAYGVPVVVSKDEPHGPEFAVLQHGTNAEIIPSDSVPALRDAIIRLVTHPGELSILHRNALKTAVGWQGVDNMVASFENAIHFAVSS